MYNITDLNLQIASKHPVFICAFLMCANNCSRVLQTLCGSQPFCLRTDVSVYALLPTFPS